MSTPRKDYTPFIDAWNAGMPRADMAIKFGYANKESVSHRASRLGLPRRDNLNIERDADIYEDHCAGMSIDELCRNYDLSRSRIGRIVRDGADEAAKIAPPAPKRKPFSCAPAAIMRALQRGGRA